MKKSVFKCLVTVLVLCCYAQAMQDYGTALGSNPKMADISQTGELSFYFAGYEDLAKPEHGNILISVILEKTTVEKKTNKDGKTVEEKKFEEQVIGSGTLKEGFNVRIKDPKSDQYEVIVKVKDDRLVKSIIGIVTGVTKVGDANIRDLNIKLQKTMYITAHEIIASKSAANRGATTYSFAVKAATSAPPDEPKKDTAAGNQPVENKPVVPENETATVPTDPAHETAAQTDRNELEYFKENLPAAFENAVFFQNVMTDWEKLGLRGKVKSVKEEGKNNQKFEVFFNEKGQITQMLDPSRGVSAFTYTGEKLVSIRESLIIGKANETVIRYNDKGQMTASVTRTEKEKTKSDNISFTYASNGMMVQIGYSTDGPVVWKWRTLEFDEKTGLLIREIPETGEGIATLYEYDEKGRCVKKTASIWENEHDGIKQVRTCVYTYNARNDIERKTCTCQEVYEIAASTVCPPENVTYSYTYDNHNNWTVCSDGRKRKIEYYSGEVQDCIDCDTPEETSVVEKREGPTRPPTPTPRPAPTPPTPTPPGQSNNIVMKTADDVVNFELRGTGNITIDWGDGTRKTYEISNTNIRYAHFYSSESERTITITGNNITYIECTVKGLTSLDVSKCTTLVYLDCSRNKLTSLDLSKNTALEYVDCCGNNLTGSALNDLFRTLNSNSGNKNIYAYHNPGQSDCDPSIATNMGWTVRISAINAPLLPTR